MDKFEKAVTTDTKNYLKDVYFASYSLVPKSKEEIRQIAEDVNKKLGYPLFDDMYYPRLIHEFNVITQMAQENAVQNNK